MQRNPALQAYNDPGSMAGVAEQSESGTHTVYMDRSFLLDRVKGVLQVLSPSCPCRNFHFQTFNQIFLSH